MDEIEFGKSMRSLLRAISVIKSFTLAEPEQSVAEIARKVGIPKTTAYRILACLANGELLVRNAETGKYTNQELVSMSVEYAKKGRLAPITPVVAPVCSPDEPMKDANWLERGMFTPVKDPVYGELVVAQAQHKMTETPIRTKWVCRPVGHDNKPVYLKYMGFGAPELEKLKKAGII